MTKDILINISGLHMGVNGMESDEDEPIEVLSAGTYYFKNGRHYVFFEEVEEGLQGVTKTQIRWQGSEMLEVKKHGLSNMHMVFEKNKKNICYYNTPYGQLNLGIFMTDMIVEENEDNINIRAQYSMDVNYEPFAECMIRINVRPRDAKEFSLTQKMRF